MNIEQIAQGVAQETNWKDAAESLRQQLAAANAEIARRVTLDEMNAEIARRVTLDEMNAEIESATKAVADFYEKQLAAANAEIERLKYAQENPKFNGRYDTWQAVAGKYRAEVAASQLREQQLRENVRVVCGPVMDAFTDGQRWNDYQELIDQPTDTSALEAMIARAGELMRERCDSQVTTMRLEYHRNDCYLYAGNIAEEIRALPGVTLEDLK